MSRASGKYRDIPDGLLSAYREYQRLWRKGLPVPAEVAAGAKAYRKECRRRREPEAGRRILYRDMPEELREAAREYGKMRRKGRPIPKDVAEGRKAYERLCCAQRRRSPRWRALPPKFYWPPRRHDIPEDLREAAAIYRRTKRRGEAVPEDLAEKMREYWRLCYRAFKQTPYGQGEDE